MDTRQVMPYWYEVVDIRQLPLLRKRRRAFGIGPHTHARLAGRSADRCGTAADERRSGLATRGICTPSRQSRDPARGNMDGRLEGQTG